MLACLIAAPLFAQMPDMKQMSGIPRPVDDLPAGALTVRVIRGTISNNVVGETVALTVGGVQRTAKTDDQGRAEFTGIPAGADVKASATVDGERLDSQEFAMPDRAGVRLMLVASAGKGGGAPAPAAIAGQVTLGGQSRIVIEPGDEALNVYYLLEFMNAASAPVNPPSTILFDMPTGAVGTTLLEGSSPLANVNGTRVRVQGPFPPGSTLVQVAYALPVESGSIAFTQKFPVTLEQLALIAMKVGDLRLQSPQVHAQQQMAAEGQSFIAATGGSVAAGQPIAVTLDGLPHHSPWPRRTGLGLALIVALAGAWAATRPGDEAARDAERRRLETKRERLLAELVRLERDRGRAHGTADDARYAARRAELVGALEHVYGALDRDEGAPSSDRAGAAA